MIDIVPTILELAQIEKPREWEGVAIPPAPGRSLVGALADDVQIERDHLWWLHDGHRALRRGEWKLVAAAGDPWALYDLRSDRAEQQDLADQHPDLVRELAALWEADTTAFTELAGHEGG